MALQLLNTIAPCFNYPPATGGTYNPYLGVPPRSFGWGNLQVKGFFYEPSNDLLVAYVMLDSQAWPGWVCEQITWNAKDGSLAGQEGGPDITLAYTVKPSAGSFGKIFAAQASDTQIVSVAWDTLFPDGDFAIDPHTWDAYETCTGANVINQQDNLAVWIWQNILTVFDISNPSQGVIRGRLAIPENVDYMSYQNRTYCWLVTASGLILKCNYGFLPPRWEMLSSVQNPVSDATDFAIAFDTARSRVIVLRNRPDAVNGACQLQLEFYYPTYQPFSMTDPVPVGIPRAGAAVRFVAHLFGNTGEGITPYVINAQLVPPANGQLLSPWAGTGLNGAGMFRYSAPSFPCLDTMELNAVPGGMDVQTGLTTTTTTSTTTSTTSTATTTT